MEKQSITAVFRKWPDGTIDALFPYEAELNYKVVCYSKIGQHSIADYDHVVSQTKPAKPDEYADLLAELTNHVGYDVNVIHRANKDVMRACWRLLNDVFNANRV